MPGASMTHTASSAGSSFDNTVWPWLVSMSARPRRTLGKLATTVTRATVDRGLRLARPDGDRQFLQFAATHDRGADLAANAVRSEQTLQVVGIADGGAVELDQDVALQEAGRQGWATFGHLDHEQAALLAAGEVLGGLRQRDRLGANTEVAARHL